MEEFVKELEQLPIERQKAIKEGLQKQILAQAVFVRDEQPTKFLAYIDDEIGKADASMFKMVQESSREGAVLGSISEIYIWNKERKRVLIGLKQEYMDITQADIEKQQPEPLPGELRYYCEKLVTMGYLGKVGTGYRRVEGKMTKALLAYFLKHFLNADGTFPDKEYCLMFGESRLSKAADQLSMNKKGYGKPRGYEVVENLLNM